MASTAPALKQERIVFACAGTEYAVRDVIDAAHFRGEIDRPWRELLRRIGAEEKARELGAEIESSAVDDAAVAFRYQYDLITAEETEAWLEARALNLSDFSDHFAREYWGKTFGSRVAPDDVRFTSASIDQRELLATELVLSGEFDRMATRLAWRVASLEGNAPVVSESEAAAMTGALPSNLAARAEWLHAIGRDEAWLEEMVAFEAIYRSRCAKLLTREACDRELSSLRLPLTRLEVEVIELESRNAANEALMCVRDDGMSMEDVAREGRYPYRRSELVLEEIAPELQQKYLSLTPGSMLEPTGHADGFVLSRLLAKHEPSADEAPVRARIEQRILERHFADLTSSRVDWRVLPAVPTA
jgi:hypothetical protein